MYIAACRPSMLKKRTFALLSSGVGGTRGISEGGIAESAVYNTFVPVQVGGRSKTAGPCIICFPLLDGFREEPIRKPPFAFWLSLLPPPSGANGFLGQLLPWISTPLGLPLGVIVLKSTLIDFIRLTNQKKQSAVPSEPPGWCCLPILSSLPASYGQYYISAFTVHMW